MQRRAAAAYVTLFLVIAVGAYGVSALSSPPQLDAEHELTRGESLDVDGTTYELTDVGGDPPSATFEWPDGDDTNSTTVSTGENVTLDGTTYAAHIEDGTLQLTSNHSAYQQWEADRAEQREIVRRFDVVATMSGMTGIVVLALAYLPVRRE